MTKIDETVKKQTIYIAEWTLVLSCMMEAVFLLAGKWSPAVLFANLLTGSAAVLNFLFMGITVQKAVDMEQKDAANLIRFSQSIRLLFQLAAAAAGVVFFDPAAAIIPLFFPRVGVSAYLILNKNKKESDPSNNELNQGGDTD